MDAVIIAIVVIVGAVALSWAIAGLRHVPTADPSFDPDAAARNVSILGGLAGFAVTGVVLLVSQAPNLAAGPKGLTTVLAMFVVAYVGLLSSSVQHANVATKARGPFDVAAAQSVMATIGQYYIYVGWFALRPLFQAFGLDSMADISGWLLLGAVAAGSPILSGAIVRTGFAKPRTALLVPAIGALGALAYVIAVRLLVPGGRVTDGILALTLLAFVPGALAHAILGGLPLIVASRRFERVLIGRSHLIVIAYAVSVSVIVGLLLVTVLGFA